VVAPFIGAFFMQKNRLYLTVFIYGLKVCLVNNFRSLVMKKVLLSVLVLLVCACSADLSKYATADANASTKTRMRACMVAEANSRLQAGTLFSQGISATADEIVEVCLKKLALESAGISSESQSTAETIIQNLKNLAGSN
jgi:hypothetical protein